MDTKVFHALSYGLFVLTAKEGDKQNGCIINTVTQLTSEPPQISIAVNKQNLTHDMILDTGVFNVSVLDTEASFDIFKHFGFRSGRDCDKIKGAEGVKYADNGIVYINNNSNAYISAEVSDSIDLGTHTLFIADVTAGVMLGSGQSVTYDYYHKNIKPKAGSSAAKGYRCTICGYVYEGEPLPGDFVCPVCKHGVSDFEKIG